MVTSNRSIKWIENLADQELRIRSGERASIDICRTKDEVLLAETDAFLRDLYQQCENLVKLFNGRVKDDALQIKLQFPLEEDKVGFRLIRNELTLTVSRSGLGVVQFSCRKRMADSRDTVMFTGVVEAVFGIFHDVDWHFLGSPVTPEQVARHYLTEFIQVSRSLHT